MTTSRLEPEDPRMLKWVYIMVRHGCRGPKVIYGSTLFCWLRGQLLMIEYYAYEGEKFQDDPELTLPEGEVWDDHGKKIHYPPCF